MIDWAEKLVFPIDHMLEVIRPEQFGGTVTYNSCEKLKQDFKEGKLHPADLKNAVAIALIRILKPAREHFSKGKPKKMLEDLENLMEKY